MAKYSAYFYVFILAIFIVLNQYLSLDKGNYKDIIKAKFVRFI